MRFKTRGITLMELLVSITVSVLVMAGLGAIFAGTIKVWSKVQDTTSAIKTGRIAMEWMLRDIREGNIKTANTDILEFNGIEYSLEGKILSRNLDVLAQGVDKINFTYYDKNGIVESDIDKIKFVSVAFTLTEGQHTVDFKNGASVRNSPDLVSIL